MNYTDQLVVEAIVANFVNDVSVFTAYDVTKTFRHQSSSKVYHSEVNSEVQRLYATGEMGSYNRTIVDIGVATSPFVYHHDNTDPQTYDKNWLAGGTEPTDSDLDAAPTLDVDFDSVNPIDKDKDSGQTETKTTTTAPAKGAIRTRPTKDGRITVSSKLISKLLPNSHASLHGYCLQVEPKNNTLEISLGLVAGAKTCPWYLVDEDNRIRVSKRVLAKVGLDTVDELELSLTKSGSSNIIVVRDPQATISVG